MTTAEDTNRSWATPTSASKTIQAPSTEQQQQRLVEGLNEAMSLVSEMLQTSSEVNEKFRSDRDRALTSYQIDIGIIEEEVERLELEHKLRGKKKSLTSFSKLTLKSRPRDDNNDSHQELDNSNDVVPPTDTDDTLVQVEITSLSEDEHDENDPEPTDDKHYVNGVVMGRIPDVDHYSTDSSTVASSENTNQANPQPAPISTEEKDKEHTRFDSVTSLLTSIEFFREEEAELLKLLNDAQPKDNGMTGLTSQERLEIEEKLEACRARQTQQVVQTVTDYKPRFKATNEKSSSAKAHELGLNLPSSIDDILEDAVKSVPIGGGSRTSRKPLAAHSFKKTPKKTSNIPHNTLTLNYRDVAATRIHVLQNPEDHLLTVNELSVERPASKLRSPESSSKRSLSALVK